MILTVLVFSASFIVCAALTAVVRRHAVTHQILDHPSERSSHLVATPRGGGLAIACTVCLGCLVLAVSHVVDLSLAIAVAGGGGAVAFVGWLDDIGRAAVPVRLAVQTLAAVGAVIAVGGMPEFFWGATPVHLGGAGALLATIGVVWCTNLYNFMDGIDGLAASEAVIVAGVGSVLTMLSGQGALGIVLATLAGAAGGFLIWNWQPARIFMGDVGSGLIGFIIGICVVAAQQGKAVPVTVWIVLFLAFLADATITLLRRSWAREALHIAHRKHAYQRAVQSGWSHQYVTGSIVAINTLFATLAVLMWSRPSLTLPLLATALAITGTVYTIVERTHPMYVSPRR